MTLVHITAKTVGFGIKIKQTKSKLSTTFVKIKDGKLVLIININGL